MQKMKKRMNLVFFGKRTLKRRGMGMQMMIRSLEMLKTALVMRWFVAAEHCSDIVSNVGTQLCDNAYSSLEERPSTD